MISFGGREARSLRNGEVAATGRFCRAVHTLLTIKGEVPRRGSLHTLMLGIVTASAPASCGSFHHIRRDTRCEFTDRTALLLVLPREAPGAPVRAAFRCSRTHNRHQTAAPRPRPRRPPTSTRSPLGKARGSPLGADDDLVCPMAPLYKLRRGRTVSGALHGQMDWPWKS